MASVKASGRPYTDDGHPVKAKLGRPLKGDLTDAEFDAIVPILSKPRKARGGSLEAAAREISTRRGALAALTPSVAEARRVSARWVSFQLVKRGFSGKKAIQEKVAADPLWLPSRQNSIPIALSGPRMGCENPSEPSVNRQVEKNASVLPVPSAPVEVVDSERGGQA